jgi:hypothetical protein
MTTKRGPARRAAEAEAEVRGTTAAAATRTTTAGITAAGTTATTALTTKGQGEMQTTTAEDIDGDTSVLTMPQAASKPGGTSTTAGTAAEAEAALQSLPKRKHGRRKGTAVLMRLEVASHCTVVV